MNPFSQKVKRLAIFIICVGIVVVLGWIWDIPLLKSLIPDGPTMKFSTAVCFVMSGIILFYTVKAQEGRLTLAQTIITPAVLIIAMFMSTMLLSTIAGFKTGVEDLFVRENEVVFYSTVSGQPSIGTMINFIFVAMIGLLGLVQTDISSQISRALAVVVLFIGGVALCGYVFRMPILYFSFFGESSAMALHTAVLFIVNAIGILLVYRGKMGRVNK